MRDIKNLLPRWGLMRWKKIKRTDRKTETLECEQHGAKLVQASILNLYHHHDGQVVRASAS